MKLLRLDKVVAAELGVSRSEAVARIRRGQVEVDGRRCSDPSYKCDPSAAEILVAGKAIAYREFVYLMVNKPSGLLCVSRDPQRPTVSDLAPAALRCRGLFPAGRLDKDSCGLVLLTNDGDFTHRLISPKKEIFKRYLVRVDGPVDDATTAAFARGITLADGTLCRPATLRVAEDGEQPLCEVAICEGRYHQIKRMFGVCGLGVRFLKRIAIGSLCLDDTLPEGGCRPLTDAEKDAVFEANPSIL